MHRPGELRVTEPPDLSAAQSPLLLAERLSFSWHGRVVLRDVSLAIERGALIVLRGSNGAGKTTLLRLLAGALEPDVGAVHCRTGKRGSRHGAHRGSNMSMVGAGDRGLYARLNVRANVELTVALALVARKDQRELVRAALERFDLQQLAGQRVDRLSTGQRQRVRLALGFAADPQILLLDEPSVSLDAAGGALLDAALRELADRGAAALWTTPSDAAAPLATKGYALVDGQIRAS